MTDEQLRILVAAIFGAMPANEGVDTPTVVKWAGDFIAAARASAPPARATPDPYDDDNWCAYCGEAQTPHTDSPDCQCAACLKRDARRWRFLVAQMGDSWSKQMTSLSDGLIAAEDAKEQAK